MSNMLTRLLFSSLAWTCLEKTFICIAAPVQVAKLSPKRKYLQIEGKTKDKSKKDEGNGGVSQGKYGLLG